MRSGLADVVVVVPVLRRPHRVGPLLESLHANTPAGAYRVLFAVTTGDDAEIEAVAAAGADMVDVTYERRGDYARKVNTAYRHSAEPFLFLGADDLAFHPGWLEAALRHMHAGASVVGTQDLAPTERARNGEHATHSLVRRTYVDTMGTIDQPGLVLHEGYPHEYVDDEFVATAKHRGVWSFAHDSVVEHLHPSWGKAELDDLYLAQRSRMNTGRTIYARRRRLWR